VISKFVQCKGILSYTVMMTHTQYNGHNSLHMVTPHCMLLQCKPLFIPTSIVVLEFTSCNVIPMGQRKKPTCQLHLVRWGHQLLFHEVPIPYYFTWHSNTTLLLLEHWFTKLWFVPTATGPTTTWVVSTDVFFFIAL